MKRIILYCVFFFALIVETSCGSRISNIESEKSALPQKMEGVKPEQKQAIRESLNITFEDALGNRNTRKNTYDYQNRLTEAVAKEKKTGRETVHTYSYNAYGDVATQDDTSCQTAHCGRYIPHFDFGAKPSPIVPYRHLPQSLSGMTADCRSLV